MSQMSKQRKRELVMIGIIDAILVVFLGPCILLAYPLQRWASRSLWDADERWDTVSAFAVFGLLLFVPLVLFWQPFAHLWERLALLGPASLTNWWLRSVLVFFAVPALSLALERLHPQTIWFSVRIPLPTDTRKDAPTASPPDPASSPAGPATSPEPPAPKEKKTVGAVGTVITEQKPKTPKKPRDPRPLGEVLYEEQQDRTRVQRKQDAPAPPAQKPLFNWNEGEGTYHEKQ